MKKVLLDILKLAVTSILFYFIGYILIYNVIINSRDFTQISWSFDMWVILFLSGVITILLNYKFKK